jgi:hypothetical protein
MDYLEAIQHAMEKGFCCKAKYLETVAVKEVFQGKTAWEGKVEVFELTGHPKANRAYGWGYQEVSDKMEYATVLGLPPVNDPKSAIRAFILSKRQ